MAQHNEDTGPRAVSIGSYSPCQRVARACSIALAKRCLASLVLAAGFFLYAGPPVFAQAQEWPATTPALSEGTQQFADLGDFKLSGGAIIRNCRLGYRTLGTLNALIMVSPGDQSVNPASALEFARLLKAPVIILDSSCGHISPSCISIGPLIDSFLADPASVRSTTLRNPPVK